MALANIFNIDIVVWNAAAAEDVLPFVLQTGDTDWVFSRNWTYEKIKSRMFDVHHERQHIPIAHVQYNGADHYRGWVTHSEPIEVCSSIRAACGIFTSGPLNSTLTQEELELQQKCKNNGVMYEPPGTAAPGTAESSKERRNRLQRLHMRCGRSKTKVPHVDCETRLQQKCYQAGVLHEPACTSGERGDEAHKRRARNYMRCTRSKTLQGASVVKDGEVQLQQKCKETGVQYEPPCAKETPEEKKKRWHRTRVRCGRNESSSPMNNVLKQLHPHPQVRKAMLAFAEGEEQHTLSTCDICLETRLQWFDTAANTPDAYPERHKLVANRWKVSEIPQIPTKLYACERCLSNYQSSLADTSCKKAHPYSGWCSPVYFCSKAGRHNNMHFYPTSSYLKELTEFELSCIAKYSFAANIHVMGSSLYQKGCVAHVISKMRIIVNALPRLPCEIELLIVYYAKRNNISSNKRFQRLYGVRRKLLEEALNGLMYGVPKGGFKKCPAQKG
eukprot:CAMPEP_0205868774 /NCGR_PEP_ID=MMETSP1083-20121108/9662_1 /ASSEMBLY_ACC=CAM_ASM_000430 /TAXON_ID=97485 /ORGANISM="Prymnesium parvum, Strain Texoma1" /LENGTH=500 /DNA_ID=CAMNT_0053230927 /DNA_START=72 /DNA_END=1574 /DNA_ORIENTATION=-